MASPSGTTGERITQRQRYETLRSALLLERSSFESHWREIADHLFPVRPRFTLSDRNRGDRRNQKIIDETATYSLRTLQAGLHAGLTSPARPWMKLATPDPTLTRRPAVQKWLFEVTQRMLTVFQLSNLYNALPMVYGDLGAFGTAAVGILEDPSTAGQSGDLFRCYTYPVGSFYFSTDTRGLANTFLREYSLKVGQLVEEFGGPEGQPLATGETPDFSHISTRVQHLWNERQYETVIELSWVVTPNRAPDTTRYAAQALPWQSCHYERTTDDPRGPLRESGFQEFPFLVPRWHVNAEDVYGTDCPGMTALGAIKQLQIQQKKKAQAIEKLVNPPLQGPTSLRTQKVSILPGDINFVDSREISQGLRPVHEVKPDLQYMLLDLQETQYRIKRAFFEDLFQMLGTSDPMRGSQPITAREVEERHEEKLIVLGPVLERTIDELLDPLVDRVFAMMQRQGLIPTPPQELDGVELNVEYISILAQAQKMVGVVAQDRFVGSTLPLLEAFPDVRHLVNARRLVRNSADMLGIDPDALRSDEDIDALLQGEAQAQQAQAQAEQIQRLAQGAAALGKTPMTGDTALTRIVEGVAG